MVVLDLLRIEHQMTPCAAWDTSPAERKIVEDLYEGEVTFNGFEGSRRPPLMRFQNLAKQF